MKQILTENSITALTAVNCIILDYNLWEICFILNNITTKKDLYTWKNRKNS